MERDSSYTPPSSTLANSSCADGHVLIFWSGLRGSNHGCLTAYQVANPVLPVPARSCRFAVGGANRFSAGYIETRRNAAMLGLEGERHCVVDCQSLPQLPCLRKGRCVQLRAYGGERLIVHPRDP